MSDKQQKKRDRRIEKQKKNDSEKAEEKKSMMKKLGVAAVILLSIPLFALLGRVLSTPAGGLDDENKIEIVEEDNIKGPEDARITIVEYSDFECPACAAYYPIVQKLLETFPDDVRFVYRHLPLKSIHPNAERAAQAAEAAGRQNKFFEMHDLLFEKQDEWSSAEDFDAVLLEYAKEIELDESQFATDIDSTEVAERVDGDVKAAYTLNLQSTPSFFVNGSKIQNPDGFEAFKDLIEGELNK